MEAYRNHRLGGLNYQLQYYQNLAAQSRNMKLAEIQAKNMKDLQDSLKVQTDTLKQSPFSTLGTIGTTVGTTVLGKVIPKVGKSLYAKYKARKQLSKNENGEEDEDEGDFPDDEFEDEGEVGDLLPADSDAFGSLNVAEPDSMVGTSTDLPTRLQIGAENFDQSWQNSGRSLDHPEYEETQDSYLEDIEDAYNAETEDLGRAPEEPAPRPPTRVQSLQRGRGRPAEEEDEDDGFETAEEPGPEDFDEPELSQPSGATSNNPDYFNEPDESGYTQFERDNGLDFDVDEFAGEGGGGEFEEATQQFPSASDELDRIQSQLQSGELEETTLTEDPEEGLGFFAKHLGRMIFGKPEPYKPPSKFGEDDPLSPEERSFFDDYMKDRYGDGDDAPAEPEAPAEPPEAEVVSVEDLAPRADVVSSEGDFDFNKVGPDQLVEYRTEPSQPEDLAEFNKPLPGVEDAGIEDTGNIGSTPVSAEEAAQTELPGEETPQFETAGERLTGEQMARTTLPDDPDGMPQWLKASELEPEARPSASDSTLARLFHTQKGPQEQFNEHQENLEQQTAEPEAPAEEPSEPTQPSSLAEEGEAAAAPEEPPAQTEGGYEFEGFGEPAGEEAGEIGGEAGVEAGEEAGEIGSDVAVGAEAAGDVAEGAAAAATMATAEGLDVAAAATSAIPGLDIVMGVIGGIATAVGAGMSIASAVEKANQSKEKAPDATAPTPSQVNSKPQNFNYVGAGSENYFDANQHFSGF